MPSWVCLVPGQFDISLMKRCCGESEGMTKYNVHGYAQNSLPGVLEVFFFSPSSKTTTTSGLVCLILATAMKKKVTTAYFYIPGT